MALPIFWLFEVIKSFAFVGLIVFIEFIEFVPSFEFIEFVGTSHIDRLKSVKVGI